MTLIEIDKKTYRERLNKIIIVFVVSFALLAVVLGSALIALFGDVAVNGEPVNNFRFNLLGVILALVVVAGVLTKMKSHALFHEVYYVWQLKQIHNLIYRKLKKVKEGAAENDVNAFIILNFYYNTLKQVYELDDNTLTITKVAADLAALQTQMEQVNVNVSLDQFDVSLIKSY